MSGRFRVELTVGSYAWTVTETTKPASPGVMDGLRFGWRIPEGDYSPGQPEPMTAAFSLVADDVATYADIAKGHNVGIKVWTHGRSGGTPEHSFYGRVADIVAEPLASGRIVYEINAVDYNGDLADVTVGTAPWSNPAWSGANSESLRTRLDHIFGESGHVANYGQPLGFEPLDPLEQNNYGPRTGSASKALDLLREYLRQTLTMFGWVSPGVPDTHQNAARIVTPYANENGPITTASGADFALDYLPMTTSWTAALLPPFTVTRPASTVTVTASAPSPAGSVIDACRVELGAKWRRDKASGFNRTNIDSEDAGVTRRSSMTNRGPGDPTREVTIPSEGLETNLVPTLAGYLDTDTTWFPTVIASPPNLAGIDDLLFYSPRGDALPNNWTLDQLTWHLTADESAAAAAPRQLMPRHDATTVPTDLSRWAWVTVPVVVLGIPLTQNLPGDTVTHDGAPAGYTVGVPTAVELAIERGHVRLDVVLARRLPRTPTAFRVTETNRLFQWDDFDAAPFTTATWSDVNDVDTWVNYRLSRRP